MKNVTMWYLHEGGEKLLAAVEEGWTEEVRPEFAMPGTEWSPVKGFEKDGEFHKEMTKELVSVW